MLEQYKQMIGRTMPVVRYDAKHDVLRFEATDGYVCEFYYKQDCCEDVLIEDIVGDLADLRDAPLVQAECTGQQSVPSEKRLVDETGTWTFYKFATAKGSVTVRWGGYSNGYYSEAVDFREFAPGHGAAQ